MDKNDSESQTIGDRLRLTLAHNGLSMREFAEISEIPYRSLQAYASDRQKPGADAVIRMSETLEVTTDWLLCGILSFRIKPAGPVKKRAVAGDLTNLADWLSQFENPEELVQGALAMKHILADAIHGARWWKRILDKLMAAQEEGKLSGVDLEMLPLDDAYQLYEREFGEPNF